MTRYRLGGARRLEYCRYALEQLVSHLVAVMSCHLSRPAGGPAGVAALYRSRALCMYCR